MEIYQGLVLAQRTAGDRGKFIDILTEKNTMAEVYVRTSRKASASAAVTQPFSYARFSLQQRKGQYTLDSAEPIRLFYRLRESLSRLSLATYFCELVRLSVREQQHPRESCEVLRLMLNTLHYLENGEREECMLKPLFELRFMTELGMMPDLLMCRSCGVFLPKRLYFSVEQGCFFCTNCGAPQRDNTCILIPAAVLQAMRHIVFADFSRLFCFRLGKDNLRRLGHCTERFVQYHCSLRLDALQFYHQISAAPPFLEESQHEST